MSERIETVVLDSEGLSAWITQDRKLLAMLQVFHDMGADLVIGANTIVEVTHSRTNMPRLNWTLSRIKVEPVTEQAAKTAAELLKAAGLHGHKYAIDATVAEVALRQPKPVALLTSDRDDMTKLCGNQVRVIPSDSPPARRTRLGSLCCSASRVPHPCPAERTTAVRCSFQRPGPSACDVRRSRSGPLWQPKHR